MILKFTFAYLITNIDLRIRQNVTLANISYQSYTRPRENNNLTVDDSLLLIALTTMHSGAFQVSKILESKPISVESKFTWEIKNFPDINEPVIESTKISVPDVDARYWLTLFPKFVEVVEVNERNKTVFNFSLRMPAEAWKTSKFEFEVNCSTVDKNLPNNATNRRKVFQLATTAIDKEVMTISADVRRNFVISSCSKINSLMLEIKVSIKYFGSASIRSKGYDPYAENNEILANVRGLYNNPNFTDFIFIVKNKEFKVHKNIVAAASQVFMKLFTTDMEEKRSNECTIDHIEPEIFQKLLECIYKGKVSDDLEDYAKELYSAADYYGIERLKTLCKTEVHESLNQENAFDTFKWACRYNLDDLKCDSWEILKR